jgi:hypothetical protein
MVAAAAGGGLRRGAVMMAGMRRALICLCHRSYLLNIIPWGGI